MTSTQYEEHIFCRVVINLTFKLIEKSLFILCSVYYKKVLLPLALIPRKSVKLNHCPNLSKWMTTYDLIFINNNKFFFLLSNLEIYYYVVEMTSIMFIIASMCEYLTFFIELSICHIRMTSSFLYLFLNNKKKKKNPLNLLPHLLHFLPSSENYLHAPYSVS